MDRWVAWLAGLRAGVTRPAAPRGHHHGHDHDHGHDHGHAHGHDHPHDHAPAGAAKRER
jgi:hypothetical protein